LAVEDGKAAKDGGYVYTFQVADESGSVLATFWNEVGASVKAGDIILMAGGYKSN
jgi:ssDNA-binding replication factor A large subunit